MPALQARLPLFRTGQPDLRSVQALLGVLRASGAQMRLPAMNVSVAGVRPQPSRLVAACAVAGFPVAANAPATKRATRSRNREDRCKAARVDLSGRTGALPETCPSPFVSFLAMVTHPAAHQSPSLRSFWGLAWHRCRAAAVQGRRRRLGVVPAGANLHTRLYTTFQNDVDSMNGLPYKQQWPIQVKARIKRNQCESMT